MLVVKYFLPAFVWCCAMLVLLLIPGDFIPHVYTFSEWLQWDKLIHCGLFSVFCVLLLTGLDGYRLKFVRKKDYLTAFLLSVAIGAITECLQYCMSTGRDGNVYDFCANVVGSGLGCLFFFLWKKNKAN
ncbi:MAG: VanZ family protein [Bacteroidales bacterium]|jgi:glycopeptide antibiotics resistance protein|nr:VanZ family protein [Bacteroidales bacterium]